MRAGAGFAMVISIIPRIGPLESNIFFAPNGHRAATKCLVLLTGCWGWGGVGVGVIGLQWSWMVSSRPSSAPAALDHF